MHQEGMQESAENRIRLWHVLTPARSETADGPDRHPIPSASSTQTRPPCSLWTNACHTVPTLRIPCLLSLVHLHCSLTGMRSPPACPRYSLDQPPIAMDCLGSHILLASEPLEITLLEVAVFGELSPTASPHATVSAVRKISMYDVGRQLSDVALVPLLPTEAAGRASASPRQCVLLRWGGLLSVLDLEQGCEVPLAQEVEAFWLSDALTCQAGGLAGSGELGLGLGLVPGGQGGAEGAAGGEAGDAGAQRGGAQGLDLGGLESGAEGSLVLGGAAGRGARGTVDSPLTPSALRQQQQQQPSGVGVESSGSGAGRRGTTEGIAAAAATLDVEMPWWLYGPAGMQLCFPSSLGSMAAQSYMSSKDGNDIELEFDQVRGLRPARCCWCLQCTHWLRVDGGTAVVSHDTRA